jgi:hypothetical protein
MNTERICMCVMTNNKYCQEQNLDNDVIYNYPEKYFFGRKECGEIITSNRTKNKQECPAYTRLVNISLEKMMVKKEY